MALMLLDMHNLRWLRNGDVFLDAMATCMRFSLPGDERNFDQACLFEI
jgi:hypothetical protein